MEATAADLQMWSSKKEEEVAAIAAGSSRKYQRLPSEEKHKTAKRNCARCSLRHGPNKCPAQGKTCYKCQKPNNFAQVCKSKEEAQMVDYEVDSDDEDTLAVDVEKVGKKLLAHLNLREDQNIKALTCQIDTAASCNVMAYRDYQKLGRPELKQSNTVLTMYDGRGKKSLGTCSLEVVSKEGQEVRLKFEVLDTNKLTLLSLDTSLKLRLISYEAEEVCVVDEYQRFTKEQIRQQYPEVFKGIGALPGEYDILLDETVPPVQHRPRKIPLSMKAAVEEKLQQLEEKGLIARVDQPTDWISNLTAVWKADKKQVRVCLDPQELNKAVKRNHYNMPTLDDLLPQLAQAKTFSLLDAKDGFLQVKLSERNSYYTAFWGPQARYRWLRMPFGLSSAPEEFQ
jgi:hypothetical protein